MFGKRYTLFKLFGFAIRIDTSWLAICLVVVYSLAEFLFPAICRGLPGMTYWWMGTAGALGLFSSVIFHELSHSVVARRYGVNVRGITLFMFGGVAEMDEELPDPKSELLMAISGPISSLALGGLLFGLNFFGARLEWPLPVSGVVIYLAAVNILLSVFNLIPAFPLDGGRVFRALVWNCKNDLEGATRLASYIGQGFGVLLATFGIFSILRKSIMAGAWWMVIGIFLCHASRTSYRQLLARKALEGAPVRRFMKPNPVIVSSSISVKEFMFHHSKDGWMFPVVKSGRLIGCITSEGLKRIPRREWDRYLVEDVAGECSPENTIAPETDAGKALSRMYRFGVNRLIVADGYRVLGMVALNDMLRTALPV